MKGRRVIGKMRTRTDILAYVAGVVLLACVGFFSPWWYLGFLPLGAGCVWAYYDVVDVKDGEHGDAPRTSRPD